MACAPDKSLSHSASVCRLFSPARMSCVRSAPYKNSGVPKDSVSLRMVPAPKSSRLASHSQYTRFDMVYPPFFVISQIRIAAATPALSDSARPAMGMISF